MYKKGLTFLQPHIKPETGHVERDLAKVLFVYNWIFPGN